MEADSPGDFETPGEFTIADAPAADVQEMVAEPDATVPATAPANLTYVGPPYDKGIQLGGTRELIRPAAFNQEQIAAFLDKHPGRSHWWRIESH